MRIGIDARPLITETPSGIGMYLLQIMKRISENTENQYFLYTNEPIRSKAILLNRFEKRVVSGIGTLVICLGLKDQLEKDKIDVFWGTEHMLPLNTKGIKRVLTVHDLSLLINPRWGSNKNVIMQNVFGRLSCKNADVLIADSEATKRDLMNVVSIPQDKINVIYLGGGDSFRST